MAAVTNVVITGAGGALGAALARWWAEPDIHLVLIDCDQVGLDASRGALAGRGARVTAICVDVTQGDALKAAIASVDRSTWSRPPTLILAHGTSGRARGATPRMGALDPELWRETLEINLTSMVFTIQALLPAMTAAGGGRIVIVSSAAGVSASPTAALAYSVAKAALAALPRLLAPQLGAMGVLINAVAPGKFINPRWPDEPAQVERYVTSVPVGRLASTDEVAALIGFLGSVANTYVTGQTILQDGGRLSGAAPAARE